MACSRLIPRKRVKDNILSSIVVSNIPAGTKEETLVIHFQQSRHGGGDVSRIALAPNGENAVVTFDDAEIVEEVLKIEHKIEGSVLKVDRCQEKGRTAIDEVFSQVTAAMDLNDMDVEPHEGTQILNKIKAKVGVSFEYKERQFLIRGSLREINECHTLLQKYLVQDENISDKFSNFSLEVEDVSADKERTNNTTLVSKTLQDENTGVIIATPVYDSDEKELVNEKLETEEAKQIVNPMISNIQTFKTDPLALSFIRQFYTKQMQDISKECLVSFDGGNIDTQVTVKPLRECDPIRYNDACSRFFMLLNSASQGMTTWELDLKADEEEAAIFSIRLLLSKYPVILDKLQEDGPFVVYGDSASVEQVKLTVQGRISDEAVGGDVFSVQQLAAVGSESVSIVTYSYCTEDGVNISLRYGDITAENVDAIVNPANEFLQHGAGLAKYIAQKGGNQLIQTESDNLIFTKRRGKRLNVGEAVHTEAGNLPCKYVIHAVGPEWGKQSEEKTVSLLEKACVESLNLASKLCLSSIALPAISSGVFRVPIELCAFAMLNGVVKYLEQHKKLEKEVTKKAVRKGASAEKNTDGKKLTKKASRQEAEDVKEQEGTRLGDIRFVLVDANAMDVLEKECFKRFPNGGENESSEDESL